MFVITTFSVVGVLFRGNILIFIYMNFLTALTANN